MRIKAITLHNFRSFKDETINLEDYSLLTGPNNSGKSNILDSIRMFYEKDIKFDFDRDFPKFRTSDRESWMEIEYRLVPDEATELKQEYLIPPDSMRVRKWFFPSDKEKKGLFGYESGKLSSSLFYGWENVSKGKLGQLIYVPAVSYLEEHTKMTGPSVLRDLINDILKPIVRTSEAFQELAAHFNRFGATIKTQETRDHRSLAGLEESINANISSWGAEFALSVESPTEDDIIKNLISHSITENALKTPMKPSSFGHGFQRHFIFTLLRLAATYVAPKPAPKKKEFAPELSLLLYEEPEAFLHPPQQDMLDTSLRTLSSQPGRQVLIATHSPLFLSYNTDDLVSLVRLSKIDGETSVAQLTRDELAKIFDENQNLKAIVECIDRAELDMDAETELEAVRHFLWLNPARCSLFFADMVLLVEGNSEQVLINYLTKNGKIKGSTESVFVMDTLGKFNIPRFMKLLGAMKIPHSVLQDYDGACKPKAKPAHEAVNGEIQACRNSFTRTIERLPSNLEQFLGPQHRQR